MAFLIWAFARMPNEFHNNKINRTCLWEREKKKKKQNKKKQKKNKEFLKHPVPKLCLLVKIMKHTNGRNDTL